VGDLSDAADPPSSYKKGRNMKIFRLNSSVAFREKNGVYVFYYDFSYLFFSGQAAQMIAQLLSCIRLSQDAQFLPGSFLRYLKERKILEEV
jgi:hypothetical protein